MWQQIRNWLETWGKLAGAIAAIFALVSGVAALAWSAYAGIFTVFDSQVIESLSVRQKEAFNQQVKLAVEDVLNSDLRIKEIDDMVRPFFAVIDSGYTYTFDIRRDGISDVFSFKFLAQKNKQKVHCYITSKRDRLRVGDDIRIRIDGLPFKVKGSEYVGYVEDKLDITDSLDEEAQLHTIEVNEIDDSVPVPGSHPSNPANLLILVSNDLKSKEAP